MKKITMTLFAVFALSGAALAQTPDIKLGAKAGLNVSTLSNLDHSKSKTGFHVGALAEIFINEKFAIQPEILYSSQGAKGNNNFKRTLDYINIPILAKYYVIEGLSVQAGPQIGFNVKADEEFNNSAGTKISREVKDDIQSVDFGLNFGLGYDLPYGLLVEARYNLGLTNINKQGKSSKNGVFQVSLGYKF